MRSWPSFLMVEETGIGKGFPFSTEKLSVTKIFLKEFLEPLGVTQYLLAKDISEAPRRVNEIVHGKRSITADTALHRARYFGSSEHF